MGTRLGTAQRVDSARLNLSKLFSHKSTELVIGIMILCSVILTLVELSLGDDGGFRELVSRINYVLTVVFAIELSFRFLAESRRPRFVRSYFRRWWVDLLAVVPTLVSPLLEGLAVLRGFRLFYFFRVLRLGRLFSTARYLLPYVVRRGAIHLALVSGALFATVVVGTSLILSFERLANPGINTFEDAFWFSLYSLFAGEPVPGPPATLEGRIASVVVMFMGLLVFAALVGTVSAFMIERLQKEGRGMRSEFMENHIIVCGLGTVGYRILETLVRLDQQVVAIEKDEESQFIDLARAKRIPVIVDDVRKHEVLIRAGLEHAKAVVACTNDDLTNLEIALDARHDRPDIRVVLRLFDERLGQKVAEGFNIQVALSSSALAAPAFAAAAIDRSVRGSLEVGDRLYIHSEFQVPEESALVGRTIGTIRDEFEIHTLWCRTHDGDVRWAPPAAFELPGDSTIAVVGPFDRVALLKEECGITHDLVRAFNGSSLSPNDAF